MEAIASIVAATVLGVYRSVMRRFALLAAGAFVIAAPPAAACSVVAGYEVPSNLELVSKAETIVLAQVVAGALNEQDPAASTVTIQPIAAIKGPLPQGQIALRGMMLSRDVGEGSGALSNPYEFVRAHPVSYAGACIRYVFPLGTTALFFLRTDHDGMWAPAAEPFTRWAEDVPGEDAPWVELVRLYVRAAELAEPERIALLEHELIEQRARTGDPLAQLIAADVERQLGRGARPAEPDIFADDGGDSAVEATLKRMRQRGAEAGN